MPNLQKYELLKITLFLNIDFWKSVWQYLTIKGAYNLFNPINLHTGSKRHKQGYLL